MIHHICDGQEMVYGCIWFTQFRTIVVANLPRRLHGRVSQSVHIHRMGSFVFASNFPSGELT